MAKKIPKARPNKSTSLMHLFLILLVPWLVMGASAAVLISVGVSGLVAFFLALGVALVVTVIIGRHERDRAALARAQAAKRDDKAKNVRKRR